MGYRVRYNRAMTQTSTQATTQAPEIVTATSTRVGCDGGAGASRGALGHPLVYITLVPDASGTYTGECGYCDRKFVLAAGAAAHGH